MIEVSNSLLLTLAAGSLGFNVLLVAYLLLSLRSARRASQEVVKEIYGTMKKIEGFTAGRREQMLREYDRVMQNLSVRLPTVIAAEAADSIFETESKILTRLAEIDPFIREEKHKEQINELIRSMENLQETLVKLLGETAMKVLTEARKEIAMGCDD